MNSNKKPNIIAEVFRNMLKKYKKKKHAKKCTNLMDETADLTQKNEG